MADEPDEQGAALTDEARAAVDALLLDERLPVIDVDAPVYERVLAILDQLPAIGKDSRNQQQGFMYRSHDDVLNALNPLLARYGVFMVPNVLERLTDQRATSRGGVLYEVNLHVRYDFYGPHGDTFSASAWGEGTDSGDKSTNKAMTMAFKNVIAQVFAVSTSETVDTDSTSDETTTGRASVGGGAATPAPDRAVRRSRGQRGFDPGVDLAADAPTGEGFQARLGEMLVAVGPVDWQATLEPAVYERWGVPSRTELAGDALGEYWRRLSNMAAKLVDENDLESFPPLAERSEGDTTIREAVAWAFGLDGTGSVRMVMQETADPLDKEAEEAAAAE